MAIARGAGTEIIRSTLLHNLDSTAEPLIYGVRHHIYTVLSIIVKVEAIQAAGNWVKCYLVGYDSGAGTAQSDFVIFHQDMTLQSTFVWNDKFSFNGYEPVDFTGPISSEAEQDAIADQLVSGDSNRQILNIYTEHADDNFDVLCTYIDQNNA
jgi:hypothetical protein